MNALYYTKAGPPIIRKVKKKFPRKFPKRETGTRDWTIKQRFVKAYLGNLDIIRQDSKMQKAILLLTLPHDDQMLMVDDMMDSFKILIVLPETDTVNIHYVLKIINLCITNNSLNTSNPLHSDISTLNRILHMDD